MPTLLEMLHRFPQTKGMQTMERIIEARTRKRYVPPTPAPESPVKKVTPTVAVAPTSALLTKTPEEMAKEGYVLTKEGYVKISEAKPVIPPPTPPPKYIPRRDVQETATVEQIIGTAPGYGRPREFPTADVEAMELEKEHYIGRDVTTGEPIYIPASPYQVSHGYTPADINPETISKYRQIESDIQKNLDIAQQNIGIAQQNIDYSKQAIDLLPQANKLILDIKTYAPGSIITYTETDETGRIITKTATREELLSKARDWQSTLEKIASEHGTYVEDLTKAHKDVRTSSESKNIISGYKKYGYDVLIGDEGYSFKPPKASEVYVWKHGEEISGVALASSAFLKSPLAIGTLASAIQYGITKEEKVKSAEFESLSEYALGLDVAIRKGEYVGKVLTSPAMVEGVYIPVLTLGAGMAISEGISVVAPRITEGAGMLMERLPTGASALIETVSAPVKFVGAQVTRIGATPFGKLSAEWGLYGVMTGGEIIETALKRPEILGATIAESAFAWGLGWEAIGAGIGEIQVPKGRWVEQDIRDIIGVPKTAVTHEAVGTDVLLITPVGGKGEAEFIGIGRQFVREQGRLMKPVAVDVKAVGVVRPIEAYPGAEISEATGILKTTVKWRKGLKIYEETKFRPFEVSGVEYATVGERRLQYGITTVEGVGVEEPTVGETFAEVARIGEKKGVVFDIVKGKGEFSNIIEDIIGKQKTIGFVITLPEKAEGGLAKVISAEGLKTTQKLEMKGLGAISQEIQKTAMKEAEEPLKGLTADIDKSLGAGLKTEAIVISREFQEPVSYFEQFTKPISRPKLKTIPILDVGIEEEERELISPVEIVSPIVKPTEREGEELGMGTELGTETNIGQAIKQELGSISESKLEQELALAYDTLTIGKTAFVTPKIPGIQIPRIPRKPKKEEEPEYFKKQKKGRELYRKTTRPGRRRGLLPDIYSATTSQALYGKATPQRLTSKLWKEAEKTLFMKVPTAELIKKGVKRRRLI